MFVVFGDVVFVVCWYIVGGVGVGELICVNFLVVLIGYVMIWY